MTLLTYVFVQVIVSSIRTNRARCALYKKILDLLDKESAFDAENVFISLVLAYGTVQVSPSTITRQT